MSTKMTSDDWVLIRHFAPYSNVDQWGSPMKMERELVFAIDSFRERINRPIYIHCGFENRPDAPTSWHNRGYAADLHIAGLSAIDQYLLAERFDLFNGIGIYPFWNNPGIHVDTRPYMTKFNKEARWMKITPLTGRRYDPITASNFLAVMQHQQEATK